MATLQRIGFAGLGLMGSRMAANLLKKGFEVTVWNRTVEKTQALAAAGAKVAPTPRALAEAVDAFVTCVADPDALVDVAFGPDGLMRGTRRGQLFIDCSTISLELVKELGHQCDERGVAFLDAPVTGSKGGAEKGTLVLMVGGTAEALAQAEPIFKAVGEKVIHCGPLGAGTQVKLAGNALIAAMLQAFTEGLLLTSKAGVDPRKLIEVVQASGFRSPYFEFKGNAMLARDFAQHFSVDLMHKDLKLFLSAASQQKVPTPTAASLEQTYTLARAMGKGQLDICGVLTAFEDVVGHKIS